MQAPVIRGYRLVRELGGGGQGAVWEAIADSDGTRVALKVIHTDIREQLAERIRQEANLLASISDAGLPRFVELVEQDGSPVAIVMELVQGVPMTAAFAAEGLRDHQKREFLVELARVLALLHGRGVVHRDVKPGNVLVRPTWRDGFKGAVVLIDLSLAKRPAGGTRTEAGLVMGTPAFLAPEFLLGHQGSTEASATADVFGWGVIAWLVLFGQHPSGLDTESEPVAFMRAYLRGAQSWLHPTAADALARAGANAGVVTTAIRALRDDPASRPQNGEQLLASLDQWGAPTGVAGLAQPGQYTALKVETWASLAESDRTTASQAASRPTPSMSSTPNLPVSSLGPSVGAKPTAKGLPILLVSVGVVLVVGILGSSIVALLVLGGDDKPVAQPVPTPVPVATVAAPTPQTDATETSEPTEPTPRPQPTKSAPVARVARDVSVSVTVVVDGHKASGNPWDVGSGPDPRISISAAGQSRSLSCQDRSTCSGKIKLKLKPGDSVTFNAYDADVAFNDPIGSYTGKYFGPGSRLQGRGGSATFKATF